MLWNTSQCIAALRVDSFASEADEQLSQEMLKASGPLGRRCQGSSDAGSVWWRRRSRQPLISVIPMDPARSMRRTRFRSEPQVQINANMSLQELHLVMRELGFKDSKEEVGRMIAQALPCQHCRSYACIASGASKFVCES